MPPRTPLATPASSFDTLTERVENLRCDVVELKTLLREYMNDARTRSEKRDQELIILTHRVDAAHNRLDDVKRWREDVEKLIPFLKAEAWLVAAISVPLIIWIGGVVLEWVRAP